MEEEVARVIRKLTPKRSGDVNDLSVWLIKNCFVHIQRPLTALVNASFETGVFPSSLKKAKVIPIFKKDDRGLTNNYRPISILPVFSKVFEKLYLDRLTKFLGKYSLLSEHQFGFRSGKSTTDAVVSLVDMIVEGIESRRPTLSVFLDLSKAFDCVDHGILLERVESYGVRGLSLKWLRSYLSDRSQNVQIANKLSRSEKLSIGVPQGSILSPLLFLIYVNDVDSSLHHGRLVQYADDTSLCFSAESKTSLEVLTFIELNNCIQNFSQINLKTNPSKSKFIHFCLRPRDIEYSPAVMVADSLLEAVNCIKFLGINLDRCLTWNEHVNAVCSKVTSGIYVLRNLSKYCPTQVLVTAYYGLIYPHLSYGIVLWGGCASTVFTRLFRLQKKAVRIILKLNSRESCREAFRQLQLLTLPCLYILETSVYCMSKCALTQGRDIHSYSTRGRDNYRTGQHRTAVHERLPSQAGVAFLNKLPENILRERSLHLKKSRLKSFLASRTFYSVGEFLEYTVPTAN